MVTRLGLKQHNGLHAKLGNYLEARTTGRERDILFIDHGNCAQRQFSSFRIGNRCEDRGSLGTDGQSIGGVFDIASSKDLSFMGQDCCPYFESGVRSMGMPENVAG